MDDDGRYWEKGEKKGLREVGGFHKCVGKKIFRNESSYNVGLKWTS